MAIPSATKDTKSLTLLLGLRLRGSQIRAGHCVNRELIRFCWQAGSDLAALPKASPARRAALAQISRSLAPQSIHKSLFSPENIEAMARFQNLWPDQAFVHDSLSDLTWEHQKALLKVKSAARRKRLALNALSKGWSAERLGQEAL